MSDMPYAITVDDPNGLMLIRFDTVFWDVSVAQQFARDALAAAGTMTGAPGAHMVLVDLRNAVLQSQDVYERMKQLIGGATARKIALVACSPLARMQTKRLQLRDNIVLFAEIDAARAWLFEQPVSDAA